MKSILILAFAILTCCCCSDDPIEFSLHAEKIDRIDKDSKIFMAGKELGKVTETSFKKDGTIIINCQVEKETQIPSDSDFINAKDLFGTANIEVRAGKSPVSIKEGDRFNLQLQTSLLESDSVRVLIENLLKNLSGQIRQDSILKELKRLNTNLENLRKD